MPGLNSNLYPPVFKKSYIPAFNVTGSCKVNFTLSIYNSIDDIDTNLVQVKVLSQKTNQSVLDRDKYPTGIMLTSMGKEQTQGENNQEYYIIIKGDEIQGGFKLNEYYKVQIRFTQNQKNSANGRNNAPKIENNRQQISAWLNEKYQTFSEWSTTILIKPISEPTISLKYFNNDSNAVSTTTTIMTNDLTILGMVSPGRINDEESFKSYRILIKNTDNEIVQDSGDRFFINGNQIQYNCKYKFLEEQYTLTVQILTKNLFFKEESFNFNVSYIHPLNFEGTISARIDEEEGCAIVTLKNNVLSDLQTNIVIRRSSNKDNFMYWEDVYTTILDYNEKMDIEWRDYTIESGVWYKYSVARRNRQNYRSPDIEIIRPIMGIFNNIFLTDEKAQLKIKFNPQVNNYSRVISEALVETIGSKYPFIRRNGKKDYRTFSISGTISYFSDIRNNLMRSSSEDLHGSYSQLYKNYNLDNNINLYNDIIQEKGFREKVLDFLYDDNAKLYKSSTQGNLIVKLMNISLTPNNTLGRRIYDFTGTIYEIDDFNYQNCINYGIQNCGGYTKKEERVASYFGQLVFPNPGLYFSDTKQSVKDNFYYLKDLKSLIEEKYSSLEDQNKQIEVSDFKYLKIHFTSNPYLIGINNTGKPFKVDEQEKRTLIITENTPIYVGHIITIGTEDIIVNREGIYELSDSNTSFPNISFYSDTQQGFIDYEVEIITKEKKYSQFNQVSSYRRIGQLWGSFNLISNSTRLLYSEIVDKYNISRGNIIIQTQKIKGLTVQAAPGTVFYIKENQDSAYEKHVLNEAGLLQFNNPDTDIRGIYIVGPSLSEIDSEEIAREGLNDYEFYDTGEVFSLSAIRNPKKNFVYSLSPYQRLESDSLIVPEEGIYDEFENVLNWIQQHNKNLLWKTNIESQGELDTETLGLFYLSFERYIYYEGQWYPFSQDNQVIIPNIQAIIDYDCTILRKVY